MSLGMKFQKFALCLKFNERVIQILIILNLKTTWIIIQQD